MLLAAACSSGGASNRGGGDTLPTVSVPPTVTGTGGSSTSAHPAPTDVGGGTIKTDPITHTQITDVNHHYVTVASTAPPPTILPTLTTQPPTTTPRSQQYILQWKLAVDYRTNPGTNPFANYLGGPKVWSLREGTQRNGNYDLLPSYSSTFGASGVSAWHDDTSGCYRTPVIASNTVDAPESICGANIPGNATWVAPSASHMAVVAWTSLFDANVKITAGVADLNASCGDGVRFYIDKGTTSLSSITLVNANALMLQPITTAVTFGQPLYFIVDAGAKGDASCDATQLVADIERLP